MLNKKYCNHWRYFRHYKMVNTQMIAQQFLIAQFWNGRRPKHVNTLHVCKLFFRRRQGGMGEHHAHHPAIKHRASQQNNRVLRDYLIPRDALNTGVSRHKKLNWRLPTAHWCQQPDHHIEQPQIFPATKNGTYHPRSQCQRACDTQLALQHVEIDDNSILMISPLLQLLLLDILTVDREAATKPVAAHATVKPKTSQSGLSHLKKFANYYCQW